MQRIVLFACLCVAAEGDIGGYVFYKDSASWLEAQFHCQELHTDLFYFNSQNELDEFLAAERQRPARVWIGLHRDPSNKTAWRWSGGGRITFRNWDVNEPNDYGGVEGNAVLVQTGKWHDDNGGKAYPYYCMDVRVQLEKKSWEEALIHCRDRDSDLPSLLSETDRLLVHAEIKSYYIGEPVWIGLRFLGDRWMWVNGDPLDYQAWSTKGGPDHRCPARRRCGALTGVGLWQNLDCSEKLHFICA